MPLKPFIRVIGIDDGSFKPKTKGTTVLIGVVFRVDNRIEGILSRNVRIDGLDSTQKIIAMAGTSKYAGQVSFILLSGVNFAGFNIVDVEGLHAATRLPVIIVFRKQPDFEKIECALRSFRDRKKRFALIGKAGPIRSFRSIFFQCVGCDEKTAKKILRKCAYHSNLPEPVRLAHLIASGVTLGQSTHP